jgi:hypothetical protein
MEVNNERYLKEYKCPECNIWDAPNIDGICENCGYKGNIDEFKAKAYTVHIKIGILIIAYNEDDVKKEVEDFGDLDSIEQYKYEILDIKEMKYDLKEKEYKYIEEIKE